MGIGSSQPVPTRPDGWVKPQKPDPMTRNTGRKRGRYPRRSGQQERALDHRHAHRRSG